MRYLLIILLGILTYSCLEEEERGSMAASNVSFTLLPSTRANELIDFEEGDAVGVYVVDRTNNSTLKPAGIMRITRNTFGTVRKKLSLHQTMII